MKWDYWLIWIIGIVNTIMISYQHPELLTPGIFFIASLQIWFFGFILSKLDHLNEKWIKYKEDMKDILRDESKK